MQEPGGQCKLLWQIERQCIQIVLWQKGQDLKELLLSWGSEVENENMYQLLQKDFFQIN